MKLDKFFEQHFVPSRSPETKVETFRQYRNGVRLFARFLNCTPRLADLSDAKIAGFMTWLLDRGRAAKTVNKHRTMLVAMVYVARRLDLIKWYPEVPKLDTGSQRPKSSDKPVDVMKRKRQIAKPYPSSADRIAQAPEGTVGHYYRTKFTISELGQCGPRTRHQYATSVAKFVEFSGGHTPMADLTPEVIEAFYRYVKATCGSSLTASKYRRQLRRILYAAKPDTPRPVHPPNKIIETDAVEGSLRWLFESRYMMERQLRANTIETYKDGLRWFDRFLGRPAMLTDLNKLTVNQWLFWSERQHIKLLSVRGRYRVIRALWNYAWHEEMVEAQPGRGIRKLRVPPVIPTCWTMPEVMRLLEATHALAFDRWTGPDGRRVHLGRFLNASIRLAYDSGLRRSDLFTVTWSQLQPDGRIVLVAQKTDKPHVARVRGDTIAALAVIRVDDDERLLPWPWRWSLFYRNYRKLLATAGLPVHRRHGLQMLRRTSATWLEAASPGAASWHLGHSTPTLARAHYLDPRYASPSQLPPELPELPKLLEGPKEDVA